MRDGHGRLRFGVAGGSHGQATPSNVNIRGPLHVSLKCYGPDDAKPRPPHRQQHRRCWLRPSIASHQHSDYCRNRKRHAQFKCTACRPQAPRRPRRGRARRPSPWPHWCWHDAPLRRRAKVVAGFRRPSARCLAKARRSGREDGDRCEYERGRCRRRHWLFYGAARQSCRCQWPRHHDRY